jgi:hypothetical protein
MIGVPAVAAAQPAHPGDRAAGSLASSVGHAQQTLTGQGGVPMPLPVNHLNGIIPPPIGVQQQVQSMPTSQSSASSTNPNCPTCNPPLLFKAGEPVMGGITSIPGHVTITPVYWAPAGYSFSASYKQIIDGYLANVAAASGSNTNVFSVATQYYQQYPLGSASKYIQYSIAAGREIDIADPFPAQGGSSGCTADAGYQACVTDGALQSEVQSIRAAYGLPGGDTNLYMMFFPPSVQTCEDPGNSSTVGCSNVFSKGGYCAYHSWTGTNSDWAIYADMAYPKLNVCRDPYNGPQAPNGDAYADSEISQLSHEANESITDAFGAWQDASGWQGEDGDECAYVYGTPLGGAPGAMYNQVINGAHYYTQDEFSNSDYAAGRGDITSPTDPNRQAGGNVFVRGCVPRPTSASLAFTLRPGAATAVGVGGNSSAWVIGAYPLGNGNYGIYHWTGASWAAIPGGATKIAVDPSGLPWVINSAHYLYHWNGSSWAYAGSGFSDIGIGANGKFWAIGTNNGIYYWNGSRWAAVPGAATRIAVDPSGLPWVINAAHYLYHWNGSTWSYIGSNFSDIGIGANNKFWVIGTNPMGGGYGIYYWSGSRWTQIGGGGVAVAVAANGHPWVINSAHQIYSS